MLNTRANQRLVSPVAEGSNHNTQTLILNIKTGIWKRHIRTFVLFFSLRQGLSFACNHTNKSDMLTKFCTTRHSTAFWRYSPAFCFSSNPHYRFQQPHLALPHTSGFKRHKSSRNPTLTSSSLVVPSLAQSPCLCPRTATQGQVPIPSHSHYKRGSHYGFAWRGSIPHFSNTVLMPTACWGGTEERVAVSLKCH